MIKKILQGEFACKSFVGESFDEWFLNQQLKFNYTQAKNATMFVNYLQVLHVSVTYANVVWDKISFHLRRV